MIAIVFALEYESAFFRARHDDRLSVAVWVLGAMGEASAGILDRKLAGQTPSLVISAGFGGGLQSDLAVGDLVLGSNYFQPEGLQLGAAWKTGPVITENAIIERGADKRALGERTGALAGDLETAHLAAVCARRGVPLLSVRCISDAVADDMPVPAEILLNPKTGRPEPLKLFRHLITNPGCVPAFNRLLKNARIAQNDLAAGLEEILPQLLRKG